MNVSLSPDLERRIAEKVEAGDYGSPSELVQAAVRQLFEAEELRGEQLQQLSREIQVGIDQADRGELIDGGESHRRLASRFSQTRR